MPDRVIKRVNAIDAKEKQEQAIQFLNHHKQPFEWTDEVPEDNLEFQGLLEEVVALYLDVLTELPRVTLEDDMDDEQVVTDEPEPNFCQTGGDSAGERGHQFSQPASRTAGVQRC